MTALTSYLPDEFFAKLIAIGHRQNFDPEDALSVMLWESEVTPTAIHPTAAGSGVYGRMFKTREEAEAFRHLPATEQLDSYERYMAPYRNVPKTKAATIYQLNFLPATALPGPSYRGTSDDTVLAAANGTGYGGAEASYYRENAGLDRDKNGAITVGDLGAALEWKKRQLHAKWGELQTRLREAGYARAPSALAAKLGPLVLLLGMIGGAVYYAVRKG